jgi:Na+-driven multidrug efflux pump
MYPLANLQIITALNSYGVHAVAGWSAADSIQTIAAAFAGGFAMAATTFIGQNIGAQNKERVVRSFWYILISNVIISGAIGAFFYLSGRFWIGVIIGADATIAIDYGMERMFFVTLFTFVSAINQTLSHSLQAFGYPLFTSISNIAFTLGFRTVWMQFVYPRYQTFTNLMSCFLVSWLLNMTFYAIFFTFVYLRYTKKGICKKI